MQILISLPFKDTKWRKFFEIVENELSETKREAEKGEKKDLP